MTPLWLLCLFAAVAAAVFADDVPQLKRGTETSGRASRQVPFSSSLSGAPPTSNVSNGNIFHNAGAHIGADPYALWDAKSGFYYVYSTAEPDPGYYFALYRSPDLSTWQRLPGGAMKGCSGYNTSSQAGNACWSSDARVRLGAEWQSVLAEEVARERLTNTPCPVHVWRSGRQRCITTRRLGASWSWLWRTHLDHYDLTDVLPLNTDGTSYSSQPG